jgi:hypothetical protein
LPTSDACRVALVFKRELFDERLHLISQALSAASRCDVFVEQLFVLLSEPIDPLVQVAVKLGPVFAEAAFELRDLLLC